MKYYVVDTTLQIPNKIQEFNTYPEIVYYLEGMCQRRYGQTRKERMIVLEEVGHGHDDNQAVNFVRGMAEEFSMGVVREDRYVRCDITNVALYQKEEFGS